MKKGQRLKYIKSYMDRHGRPRHYFAPGRGAKQVALPGLPNSTEFMNAYSAAFEEWRARRDSVETKIGADRLNDGTMEALIHRYYASAEFRQLRPITQRTYRGILERMRTDYGAFRVAELKRKHVESIMAKKASKPEAANGLRKMFKILMGLALRLEWIDVDPTNGIKRMKTRSTGFETWEEHHINQFYAAHPADSRARLAFDLLIYTGLRRGDVVTLGRQHIRDGMFVVRQSKTGEMVHIPVHPDLKSILDDLPADQLTFLVTELGKPFTAAGFGNWLRDRVAEAGLRDGLEAGQRGLSAHGLRKAICRRLAEAGCSAHEIIAITGHKHIAEVMRYTQAADRSKLSQSAFAALERRPSQGKQ
ncbi:tyrosine-type recombinase/integrase [Zhengella sp. ZM62]|uniref:tyrosine-type recombinase/integrase n=1 Tax=Zhengella sedimenti TaxID=3390035 RepID=UPI003975FD25